MSEMTLKEVRECLIHLQQICGRISFALVEEELDQLDNVYACLASYEAHLAATKAQTVDGDWDAVRQVMQDIRKSYSIDPGLASDWVGKLAAALPKDPA